MRITEILMPTDFSENSQVAFEVAYDLARQLGAKVILLHVQDGSALRVAIREELLQTDSTDEELQSAVEQLTAQRFSEMIAGLDRTEVDVECLSLRGYPKTVITKYAEEIHARLIVIGMRGITAMSVITSAMLGSVAEYVMRNAPCPTLIVRSEHHKTDTHESTIQD